MTVADRGAVRRAIPWAWTTSIIVAGIPVTLSAGSRGLLDPEIILQVVFAAGYAVLGLVIAIRQPGNGVAWILLLVATGTVLNGLSEVILDEPLGSESMWRVLATIWSNSGYFVTFIIPLLLLLFIFPNGHFLTPRWSWAGWAASVSSVTVVFTEWFTSELALDGEATTIPNPFGFHTINGTDNGLVALVLGICLLALIAGGPIAIVVRYRRSSQLVRSQIKLVLVAMTFIPMLFLTGSLMSDSWVNTVVYLGAVMGVPLAITVAIVRHNLFDIDVVISKAVTYGVLAGFITAVYAVIVVGVGSLVGGGGEPNLGLSIAAVAIVAVAFEPVRVRVQHWANVVVYGKRATPYEVLASATARLSDTSDPDEALARVAQLVAEGTGAVEAVVWLKVGDVMYPRASSPPDVVADLDAVAAEDPLAGIAADRVVAVRHRGDVLGALSITKDRADAVTGSDEKVLEDVAAGAGVLVRNMGLNAELAERAEQLRVSRRRLVAAHDAERHRLERDLHDGAQQQVVALKVKLGIARTLAEREGAEQVATMVASLSDTTQRAVDGMRAVAHGIYPPLLEAEGLEAALGAARRTVPVPVEIIASRLDRYDRTVEESVYFCVLGVIAEAVDAGATRITVTLHGRPDDVTFSVDTDSATRDMVTVEDRIHALGGNLTVRNDPNHVTVTGRIPTASLELA